MIRKCRYCGLESDDLILFRKSKTAKYGRDNFCKQCASKRTWAYYKKDMDSLTIHNYDILIKNGYAKDEEEAKKYIGL